MLRLNQITRSLLLAAALLLAAQSASAIVTVGPAGSGCQFTDINGIKDGIQDAIKYVLDHERGGSADPYIAVVGEGGHVYNEVLTIDGSNIGSYDVTGTTFDHPFVQIYGDYDGTCDHEVTTAAFLSGNQTGHSVLRVVGNKTVEVVLNHLILYDASLSGSGGGISFESAGFLDLTNVEIQSNHAAYGAGIFADGPAPGISITLHSGTYIHDNTASHGGGGINIQGETRLFALEGLTLIDSNTANPADSFGLGGGLRVTGAQALADIGSPGYNGVPVVSYNNARWGGGISIEDFGKVRLFSTYASQPARIDNNTALISGGGVYVEGTDIASGNHSHLCGDGYSISHNSAPDGAAIYSDNIVELTSQGLQCNTNAFLPDRAPCAPGTSCNTIDGNIATAGSVISDNYVFIAEKVVVQGNSGKYVLHASDASLTNCLITGNTTSENLIFGGLPVDSCTLTGNTNTGDVRAPFYIPGGGFSLQRSIVWQPGGVGLFVAASGFPSFLTDVIVDPEAFASFPGTAVNSNVSSSDPRFVDPANGDFHLQPDSPAVDYSATGPEADLDGNTRHVNVLNLSQGTTYDIGAYEVQSRGDLIFVDGLDRAH